MFELPVVPLRYLYGPPASVTEAISSPATQYTKLAGAKNPTHLVMDVVAAMDIDPAAPAPAPAATPPAGNCAARRKQKAGVPKKEMPMEERAVQTKKHAERRTNREGERSPACCRCRSKGGCSYDIGDPDQSQRPSWAIAEAVLILKRDALRGHVHASSTSS
jgi:hypothetical protein